MSMQGDVLPSFMAQDIVQVDAATMPLQPVVKCFPFGACSLILRPVILPEKASTDKSPSDWVGSLPGQPQYGVRQEVPSGKLTVCH